MAKSLFRVLRCKCNNNRKSKWNRPEFKPKMLGYKKNLKMLRKVLKRPRMINKNKLHKRPNRSSSRQQLKQPSSKKRHKKLNKRRQPMSRLKRLQKRQKRHKKSKKRRKRLNRKQLNR